MERDLIRRSDVIAALVKKVHQRFTIADWFQFYLDAMGDAEDIIKELPAVDAVEVKHGHWVTEEEAIEKDDYSLRDTCSVCGHCDWDCTESQNFNYCPNCGARMDGEDGEA